MENNNFDNKENLGHGIKGDVSSKNKKKSEITNDKTNINDNRNNLRSDKNFNGK